MAFSWGDLLAEDTAATSLMPDDETVAFDGFDGAEDSGGVVVESGPDGATVDLPMLRDGADCRALSNARAAMFGRTPRGARDAYGRRLYTKTRMVGLSYEEKLAMGLSAKLAGALPVFMRVKCLSATPPRRRWNSPARRRDALKVVRAMARDAALSRRAAAVMARVAGAGRTVARIASRSSSHKSGCGCFACKKR